MRQTILKTLKSGSSVLTDWNESELLEALAEIVLFFVPQAEEGSPRAIILCKNDEQAKAFHERIAKETKASDLTVDLIFEKGNKLKQRNDLFDGTEIIVGTTKRICELYFQNGFNIAKLKFFVVIDADEQMRAGLKGFLCRIAESLPKVKQLITATQTDEERLASYLEDFVDKLVLIESEEAE